MNLQILLVCGTSYVDGMIVSVFVWADISVKSSRKIFMFITDKVSSRIEVS